MAALYDAVIQYLAPAASPDLHESGAAPVLVGQVLAAGTGAPGATWDVMWSNGCLTIDHDNTVLRVLDAPFKTEHVGRRARPIQNLGNIDPAAIGIIRIRDDNDLYVLETEDGTFYTLSAANLQLLD